MAVNGEGGAGVGGWLAFFVLVMAVFTPAAVIVGAWGELYRGLDGGIADTVEGPTFEVFKWALVALVIAGCWYIAWRLHRVRAWRSVRIAIAGLWIIAIGSTAADLIGISLIAGVPISWLLEGAMAEIVRPLAFAGLWTFYLLRSKRVADTYPREAAPAKPAQALG
jgi:hypothetical protein